VPDSPILRATTAEGEIYEDPSEDALFMFVDELGPGSILKIERTEKGREGEEVSVIGQADGSYAVEGAIESGSSSMREAHEAVTRWAFDLPDDWRPAGNEPSP
jgi:hypothetical protein